MVSWAEFCRGRGCALLIAAALWAVAVPRVALGSVRIAGPIETASKIVRITVLLRGSGEPAKNAVVEIFRADDHDWDHPLFLLHTDNEGRVLMPTLSPGKYNVVARAEPDWREDMSLYVPADATDDLSLFWMGMEQLQFPTYQQLLERAEQGPVLNRMSRLSGVVEDPVGVRIPNAVIDVVRKGTQGKDRVLQVKTDAQGRFSADLDDGDYVAIVSASGFSRYLVLVTISKATNGDDIEVKLIKLKVGGVTT